MSRSKLSTSYRKKLVDEYTSIHNPQEEQLWTALYIFHRKTQKVDALMLTLLTCSIIYPVYVCSAAAPAKSLPLCLTLCDPIDGSLPGSSVPGILQARTLEWVAISFSNAWKWKVNVKSLSRVQLVLTPWTAAHQAPPSMGFARWEHWSGVLSPSPDVCSAVSNVARTGFQS